MSLCSFFKNLDTCMLNNKAEFEIITRRGLPINSYFVGFTLLFDTILELVHFTSVVCW